MYRDRTAVSSVQRLGQWDFCCWNHRKEAAGLRAALATAADRPAPVASGILEEHVAAICTLFPGLEVPSSADDDLFRQVEKRKRHENMTDGEVNLIVAAVVLPIA